MTRARGPRTEVPVRLSLWLMPAADLEAELSAHIQRICAVLGCSPHAPHVTVMGDVRVSRADAKRAIQSSARTGLALTLQARAIATSPIRFEALTVRFHRSLVFRALVAELRRHLGSAAPPRDPHLSLAYPHEPFDPASLLPLATGVSPTASYRFNRLAVVDPGPGRSDWQDVAAWRVIGSVPLRELTTSTGRP